MWSIFSVPLRIYCTCRLHHWKGTTVSEKSSKAPWLKCHISEYSNLRECLHCTTNVKEEFQEQEWNTYGSQRNEVWSTTAVAFGLVEVKVLPSDTHGTASTTWVLLKELPETKINQSINQSIVFLISAFGRPSICWEASMRQWAPCGGQAARGAHRPAPRKDWGQRPPGSPREDSGADFNTMSSLINEGSTLKVLLVFYLHWNLEGTKDRTFLLLIQKSFQLKPDTALKTLKLESTVRIWKKGMKTAVLRRDSTLAERWWEWVATWCPMCRWCSISIC